jgi:hypothetical protein
MKLKVLGVFACLFVFALMSTAQGFVTSFKISPKHPYVDNSEVTVTWRTDRALQQGYHYEGSILDPQHERGCQSFALAQSTRRPKKKSLMSITFSSYWSIKSSPELIPGGEASNPEDYTPGNNGKEGYSEWCDGKATFSISVAKNGSSEGSGTIIGGSSFRFYKKP